MLSDDERFGPSFAPSRSWRRITATETSRMAQKVTPVAIVVKAVWSCRV